MSPLVLIIEDQPDLANIYSEILNIARYETQVYRDGQLALDALPNIQPDLILLDMNLPHVSGHFIYRQIQELAHLASVPVIIATANAVIAQALQPELRDCDYLLIKPISGHDLQQLAMRLRPS